MDAAAHERDKDKFKERSECFRMDTQKIILGFWESTCHGARNGVHPSTAYSKETRREFWRFLWTVQVLLTTLLRLCASTSRVMCLRGDSMYFHTN